MGRIFDRMCAVLAVLSLVIASRRVQCRPNGAPADVQTCQSMYPSHGVTGQEDETNPYMLVVSRQDYISGENIDVTITGSVPFRGFLLQARFENSNLPVGLFISTSTNGKTLACLNISDSVTHTDNEAKSSYTATWTAPATLGKIYFVATVVHTVQIFWVQMRSDPVQGVPNACSSNPCYNNGACFENVDRRSYVCGCVNSGEPRCQEPCSPSPCLNGGFCQVTSENVGICSCPNGFFGELCEGQMCTTSPCQNGGTCSDLPTGFACECLAGWSGRDCSINSFVCAEDSCLNGGTCFDSNPPGRLMFFCACNPLYTGITCELSSVDFCAPNPCMNEGTCTSDSVNTYNCQCPPQYTGTQCQTQVNLCDSSPCMNEGTCTSVFGNTYNCQCPPQYSGPRCQTQVNLCDSSPCMNEGTCMSVFGNTNYNCQCPPQYTGPRCQTQVNLCDSSPCMNEGTCTSDSVNTYNCQCPPQYTGPRCQTQVNPCDRMNLCMNGGSCYVTDGSAACLCSGLYTGDYCQTPVDPCTTNPCRNGGNCQSISGFIYTCQCMEGFYGNNCETQDISCASPNPCLNGGTCNRVGDGTYTCTCRIVYLGSNCQLYTNPCQPGPCINGNCTVNLDIGFICVCDNMYTGTDCSVYIGDPCDVLICHNGGSCIIVDSQQASCLCPDEYTGMNCETALNVPPTISGCPEGENLQFPLLPGSNMAMIDLDITATDSSNNQLTVINVDDASLTFPTVIPFSEEYRTPKTITLMATDEDGLPVQCVFTVRIYDDEKPQLTCPNSFSVITTAPSTTVQWVPATATDNLALSGPIEYMPSMEDQFQALNSNQTVIARVTDTFDNVEDCQFFVAVYRKVADCPEFPGPSQGQTSCRVVQDSRECDIDCDPGFGNTVGDSLHTCTYTSDAAFWMPRPNPDVCVPHKPGHGVSQNIAIKFRIGDLIPCGSVMFNDAVTSSLRASLEAEGACVSAVCEIDIMCVESPATGRRRRALVDLTTDVKITSETAEGDTVDSVLMRLEEDVSVVIAASVSGRLSVLVGGETTNNTAEVPSVFGTSWVCRTGQISTQDGCLSCPPGTFHNADGNSCDYCPLNTYQNQIEQDTCIACPEGSNVLLVGAYSKDHCGEKFEPNTSPWTPTLIAVISAAGGLILLLVLVLAGVYIYRTINNTRQEKHSKADKADTGPLSNFSHLNRAFEEDEATPDMQFHGGSNATYTDHIDSDSPDHLIRIPSLSQYSDYYATLNARSAPIIEPDTPPKSPYSVPKRGRSVQNGVAAVPSGAPTPPPPPPVPNMNNSNQSTGYAPKSNGTAVNGGVHAKFQV